MRDFALEVFFSKWEFTAKYHLTASDAESMSLSALLAMATPEDRAAFDDLHLGYSPTWGAPALREAIAGTCDAVAAEDVLTFAGAEEAIYTTMRVLLEPGDHAVVITPNYQAAETVPLSVCEVTGVPLDADRGWSLDVDRLRDAIRPDTRLVSINFPNNPTGSVATREAFGAVIEACARHGTWLFSDEVYRGLERDPNRRLPQAVDAAGSYERAISLNVMSKAYGLPGLRIGWLACKDRDLLGRCERYKHYLSICNSAPSEQLAIIALEARDEILARNLDIVRTNLEHLDAFFADFPDLFEWHEPEGACVGAVRYRGADGVDEFTRRLVEEAGVLLLPASLYRSEIARVPDDFFRIGFGRRNLPDGLAAMRGWLAGRA